MRAMILRVLLAHFDGQTLRGASVSSSSANDAGWMSAYRTPPRRGYLGTEVGYRSLGLGLALGWPCAWFLSRDDGPRRMARASRARVGGAAERDAGDSSSSTRRATALSRRFSVVVTSRMRARRPAGRALFDVVLDRCERIPSCPSAPSRHALQTQLDLDEANRACRAPPAPRGRAFSSRRRLLEPFGIAYLAVIPGRLHDATMSCFACPYWSALLHQRFEGTCEPPLGAPSRCTSSVRAGTVSAVAPRLVMFS